jgi:hypothetical protein
LLTKRREASGRRPKLIFPPDNLSGGLSSQYIAKKKNRPDLFQAIGFLTIFRVLDGTSLPRSNEEKEISGKK